MEGAPRIRFFDAIKKAINSIGDYKTRSRRSELWFWVLGVFIVTFILVFILVLISMIAEFFGIIALIIYIVYGIGIFIISLPLGVRRLHDIGYVGWWMLLGLIPIVGEIILIVFFCFDSVRESNEWGESPKYSGSSGRSDGGLLASETATREN